MTTLNWGVLGASYFAIEHMIPALQQSAGLRVHGIASRELAKAEAVAERFGLPQAYGDYEAPCSPTPRSTWSTTRCPTTSTCPGRCRPRGPASTCSARSRSRSMRPGPPA